MTALYLLPYGDSDLLLTAKLAAAWPQFFDINAAVRYFNEVINDAESIFSEIAEAYMGLAAAGELVLPDLHALMSMDKGTWQDRMYLAAALALLGDIETARDWFNRNLRFELNGGSVELHRPSIIITNYQYICEAAALAALIGHPDTEALFEYIMDNPSPYYLPVAELMVYIGASTPPDPHLTEFSYTLNGKTETVNLLSNPIHFITTGKEQLAAANFKVLSGNILCRTMRPPCTSPPRCWRR